MPLLKIEHKCTECNTSYILAVKEKDQEQLTCCPFCGSPVDYTSEDEAE